MAMNVTNGTLLMRLWVQDTDTTLPGATDAEYLKAINDRYVSWFKIMEKRAKQSVLVTLAANDFTKASSLTNAMEILSVTRDVTSLAPAGMERMEWNELRNLQNYDSTTGTPIRYAAIKSPDDQTWLVATHPVPSGAFTLNAVHTLYPAELTSGQTPILGDAEALWVYRLAASDMALSPIGRPDLREGILAPVPEYVRAKMGVEQKRVDPKRRDETATV